MHCGLTPEEVELKYLEKAKWLTAYGVDSRSVKDCHGLQLKLGRCKTRASRNCPNKANS